MYTHSHKHTHTHTHTHIALSPHAPYVRQMNHIFLGTDLTRSMLRDPLSPHVSWVLGVMDCAAYIYTHTKKKWYLGSWTVQRTYTHTQKKNGTWGHGLCSVNIYTHTHTKGTWGHGLCSIHIHTQYTHTHNSNRGQRGQTAMHVYVCVCVCVCVCNAYTRAHHAYTRAHHSLFY